jgi:UDP:flavonoid glycosyltransferase YjiC (YdhE family)
VVLETINSIQKSNGLPLLNAVHEIFSRGERLFCTFAELDHYPGRESAEYLGPRFSLESGKITSWPDGEGKKIFCYLYSNHRHFEGVLAAMDSLPVRALVYAPRLSPDVAKRLASGRLRFINRPVNMEHARRCCDLAVCHGGHGTVSAMLLAGRPLLLLPSQMEQTMMAVQIMRQKLGLALTARPAQTDYTGMLKRLLGESRYFENAQAFAEKYHGFSPQANTTLIADHCEATVMSNPV